jgi:hypothetical protein
MFDDELRSIISTWTVPQIEEYIQKLEARITVTRTLITELKTLRKTKQRKDSTTPETGTRGGK